jgi:hypothetical protein
LHYGQALRRNGAFAGWVMPKKRPDLSFDEACEKLFQRLGVKKRPGIPFATRCIEGFLALLPKQPEFEGLLSPSRGKRVRRDPNDMKFLEVLKSTNLPVDKSLISRGVKIAQSKGKMLGNDPDNPTSPQAVTTRLWRLWKTLEAEKRLEQEGEIIKRALSDPEIVKRLYPTLDIY